MHQILVIKLRNKKGADIIITDFANIGKSVDLFIQKKYARYTLKENVKNKAVKIDIQEHANGFKEKVAAEDLKTVIIHMISLSVGTRKSKVTKITNVLDANMNGKKNVLWFNTT